MGVTLLSADAILSAPLRSVDVPVPEWGGMVRVQGMSGSDRDSFQTVLRGDETGRTSNDKFQAILLAFTLVGDDGQLLFSVDQVEVLRARSATALERVAVEAMRLNGLLPEAVADAAKNSEAAQNADSGSDSPATSD
ncbi:hypothetical protein [Herbaspirillum sp. NPDC101396]|uniref:hypothetical protein n=1 Tax=Herbaspirillum sp. NPDC101396 TaxID=3364005 RepID=UPI003839FA41